MSQIVLSIPDKKLKSFLSYINDLNYVKVENPEYTIPAWQKKEVRKRLKEIEKDPTQLISSKSALRHLKSMKV